MTHVDGIEILRQQLKRLPVAPGVYRMLDAAGHVLYVGKAKNIKNRVTQYTQPERMPTRIRKMVFETRQLEIVETVSEAEALLLEANLIKSLKPKYNIRLRDDSSFPGIWISGSTAELPAKVQIYRGKIPATGSYFGPYPSAQAAHRTVDLVERTFQLRTCSDGFYKARQRPCLKYHIKRCTAPCVGKVSPAEYQQQVAAANLFLEGKGQQVQQRLQRQMLAAAKQEDYEAAAAARDKLQVISQILSTQTAVSRGMADADVLALVGQGGQVAVQLFVYRNGQHIGNSCFFPQGLDETPEADAMQAFLALHYASHKPPAQVLVNVLPTDADVVADALSLSRGSTVKVRCPQRGDKAQIVQQAIQNAQSALARKVSSQASQRATLAEFAELLGLERKIERVECYDVSNIQGRQPVASMVVAGPDGMVKDQYRKFAVRSKETPDDYGMMAEILERRFKRLLKEHPDGTGWPQVVMIDGGVGHLNVLIRVLNKLDIDPQAQGMAICAIAKGPERDKGLEQIFVPHQAAPLAVAYRSPLIFLLQRIRDESHRVAIGYHRQLRSKKLVRSILDDIPGIGHKRKQALLHHFGSAAGVKSAALVDLQKVPGISAAMARQIYDFLHSGD